MNEDVVRRRMAEGRNMERIDDPVRARVAPANTRELNPAADDSQDTFDLINTLQGTWSSDGQGWNLIALPFKDPAAPFNYRLLMNQYNETLTFKFADRGIPNRGVDSDGLTTDQFIDGLDYEQLITQVSSEDSPASNLRSPDDKGIHHEPGLFLQMLNHTSPVSVTGAGTAQGTPTDLTLARLATIPHGDSVLALGTVSMTEGAPVIPDLNALPVRVSQDVENSPYLAPYKHFEDTPFLGTVQPPPPGFPGFFSTNANAILQFAQSFMTVKRSSVLHFDTKFGTGGIVNIPFITEQANATEMVSTFWVMELESADPSAPPEFVMQYSQTVFLDFFGSRDEPGELIRWPHVSINTLRLNTPDETR